MSRIRAIVQTGQSIWMDYIQRSFLASGEFERWIELGVTGITSNPTILEQAISDSTDYQAALQQLAAGKASVLEAYESLAIADIQAAADLLRATYDQTGGTDGFVSLEVNPHLSMDADETIAEAHRLFERIDRPNAMIKIPATAPGCRALEALLRQGVNVNVTLIFSVAQYARVLEAFQAGLEARVKNGESVSALASVASFFVSRIDSAIDPQLQHFRATELLGQTAIASATLAYEMFDCMLSSPRWKTLAEAGASPQRPLWASTSTKNPDYPDTMYVDSLIAPNTVNTVPIATLHAVLDHGRTDRSLLLNANGARHILERLTQLSIDLEEVTDGLLDQGLAKFAASFDALTDRLGKQLEGLREPDSVAIGLETNLAGDRTFLPKTLLQLDKDNVARRIWDHDHTLWSSSTDEIDSRLGWLHLPTTIIDQIDDIHRFAQSVKRDGFRQAVLLGMGGSSLAPEVFTKTFGVQETGIPLRVIDTTHPDAIRAAIEPLDPKTTLFLVATKSGTTIETHALFRTCYNLVRHVLPFNECGKRFAAITDPGSPLVGLADKLAFRKIFLNNPNVGGRYAALSHFGLVPASILGIDLEELLRRSAAMIAACAANVPVGDNPGIHLGAALGCLASRGRDKLTMLPIAGLPGFEDWLEQLIAESTGKSGTGIVPIIGEPNLAVNDDNRDRFFVCIEDKAGPDALLRARCRDLVRAGLPLIRVTYNDRFDLGGLFVLWEFATAVAGHILHVHPFDQPDVESSKRRARQLVVTFQERGDLPRSQQESADDEAMPARFAAFLQTTPPNGYVAIQAYLPSPPDDETAGLLSELRARITHKTTRATTLGYGPRFLHSTGQLHKGGPDNGRFIQLLATAKGDVAIPDRPGSDETSLTYATLLAAQAMGDRQALEDAGRSVLSVALGDDPIASLHRLVADL